MSSSGADLAVLAALLEEHRPRLLAMLRRRIDSAPIDADGILHDTYLRARGKWERFTAEGRMQAYAWLYRLALDCLIEEWRRRYRGGSQVVPLPEQSSIQMGLGIVDTGTSPSEAAVRNEHCRLMRAALAQLKDADRDILWMRHSDGLSLKEAAAVLGISDDAAAQRYVRALRRLQELWQRIHPIAEGNP